MNREKEEEIMHTLKKMPNIRDDLDKEALYQKISTRLDHEVPRKQKKSKFFPLIAAAAVLIFLISLPFMFSNENDQMANYSMDNSATQESAQMDRDNSAPASESDDAQEDNDSVTNSDEIQEDNAPTTDSDEVQEGSAPFTESDIEKDGVSIEEAIDIMKVGDSELGITATIPEEIDFNIHETDDTLLLEYNTNASLSNEEKAVIMVESILLTAKNFGYEYVMFQNMPEHEVGEYNFSEAIKVPADENAIEDTNQ